MLSGFDDIVQLVMRTVRVLDVASAVFSAGSAHDTSEVLERRINLGIVLRRSADAVDRRGVYGKLVKHFLPSRTSFLVVQSVGQNYDSSTERQVVVKAPGQVDRLDQPLIQQCLRIPGHQWRHGSLQLVPVGGKWLDGVDAGPKGDDGGLVAWL